MLDLQLGVRGTPVVVDGEDQVGRDASRHELSPPVTVHNETLVVVCPPGELRLSLHSLSDGFVKEWRVGGTHSGTGEEEEATKICENGTRKKRTRGVV